MSPQVGLRVEDWLCSTRIMIVGMPDLARLGARATDPMLSPWAMLGLYGGNLLDIYSAAISRGKAVSRICLCVEMPASLY